MLPDRGPAGTGSERLIVDPGRQPHQPRGGRRIQRPGQPDPEVLAEIGQHVDVIADLPQQGSGARQCSPA